MKILQAIQKVFRCSHKRENMQYFDNYMMLGSILGQTCSLLSFGKQADRK